MTRKDDSSLMDKRKNKICMFQIPKINHQAQSYCQAINWQGSSDAVAYDFPPMIKNLTPGPLIGIWRSIPCWRFHAIHRQWNAMLNWYQMLPWKVAPSRSGMVWSAQLSIREEKSPDSAAKKTMFFRCTHSIWRVGNNSHRFHDLHFVLIVALWSQNRLCKTTEQSALIG